MTDFQKEVNNSDIRFWTKVSDIDSEILFLKFLTGAGIKRQLKELIKDEERIGQIEL